MRAGSHYSAEAIAKMRAALTGDKNWMYGRTGDKHPMWGKHHTPETRAKLSVANKGKERPMWVRVKISAGMMGKKNCLGHKPSAETIAKRSAALKGRKVSSETRTKISVALKGNKNCLGHKPLAETRAKISAILKGHVVSPETRAKIGAASKGKIPSLETRAKMSAARKGFRHPAWLGGISREPYGWEWNAELREEVRRRDGYKCMLCGVPQAECEKALDVHHGNYDKKDSDPVNLVSLCQSCHARTNVRREYWTAFFKKGAGE